MQEVSERTLIAQLRAGDIKAFETLYEKYSAKLYNSVSLISHDKTLAKDITQASFFTVWEKRSSLDPDKSFQAYLYTIARNMVYKETRRLVLNTRFISHRETNPEIFEDNTSDDIDRVYLEEHIAQLVGELDEVPRKIFLMKREGNLSNREIANQMNISERSVEAHFYRTMKFLKDKVKVYLTIFLI